MSPLVLPPQSYLGWKVSIITLHAIAVLTTVLRLVHRFRLRKTWWDDYILFIPLVFNLAYWVVFCWGFCQPTGLERDDDDMSSGDAIFDSYWLATLPGVLVWWGTRTVLTLCLARMFPPEHPARKWSFIPISMITVLSLAAVVVTIATCNVSSALLDQDEFEGCMQGAGGFYVRNIFLFAGSLATDILLIIFSSVLLWRLKLSVIEFRLATIVIFASVIILLYTIIFLIIMDTHAVSMGYHSILIKAGLYNIQTALSLFLSNLPVVATCLVRWVPWLLRIERARSPEDPLESMPCSCTSSYCSDSPAHLTLTEISDLSSCPSSRQGELLEPSFESSYSSWHASQEASSRFDVETEEKLHMPNPESGSETE
ncbi:hypothetical protein CPB84DRAFT_1846624 [Gymnopilus junonius]|uniref:Rhodopsin domain-containing protein n=1 Tax=Gymnopilus junonius TaxID=109634 RepID=A0A9P5NR69_GYMJU|nr:hypothetical protein CPB84DRAFT_1846624 [Gymnopilus junonius]